MKELLFPLQNVHITIDAPTRKNFCIHNFESFRGAVKMLWESYQDKSRRKAERAFNNALKAHSIGQYDDAEKAYLHCIYLQPDHEPARTNLAALYIHRNSHDLAEIQLKTAVEIRPMFYRTHYNLALLNQYMSKPKDAIKGFESVIALKPDYFCAYVCLAEVYAENKKYEKAMEYLTASLPHTNYPMMVHLRMAAIAIEMRNFREAIAQYEESLKYKKLPEVHYNLGWLTAHLGEDLRQAALYFREAFQQRSDFEESLFNEALTQSACQLNEASVETMLSYVKTFATLSQEEILRHLKLLIKANKKNTNAYLEVARIYFLQSQPQKAIDTLLKVLELVPNSLEALRELAAAYLDLGRFKDAISTFRQVIKLAPAEVNGYQGLAKAYGAIENYAAALPVIEKVLELDPANTQTHYLYATLMAQEGELEIAYKHYRRVASLDPTYPRIQKRLKMIEEEMSEHQEQSPWSDQPSQKRY